MPHYNLHTLFLNHGVIYACNDLYKVHVVITEIQYTVPFMNVPDCIC